MNILNDIEDSFDQIWKSVLKPSRTPVSNDDLGFKYVFTLNENIYRRQDDTFKSFDNLQLRYTCYLKMDRDAFTSSQQARSSRKSFRGGRLAKLILKETDSIEGRPP